MNAKAPIFFCAVGGSGMLPLAMIMKARGFDVRGSDRSRDQERTPERFAFIERQGITLFPQDGSGVIPDIGKLIVSAAVEETVTDYQAAVRHNIPIMSRAALLAELFNDAKTGLAVAGTSGKSTTTGMIGWILHQVGLNPTIMNGAVMKNFITADNPFASAVIGNPDLFVSEVDESDGSIAFFTPKIAVLNNIAFDHKTMEELRPMFSAFIAKAEKVVLNLDNMETAALAVVAPQDTIITYSLTEGSATLRASNLEFHAGGARFDVIRRGDAKAVSVKLSMPGHHNVANGLAALGAALAVGVDLAEAARALGGFSGIGRRLEVVGATADGITVIDDFAHNPDKIAASLRTLHQTPGRLLVFFQPHGFGPLRLMRRELTAGFAAGLNKDDRLYLPDPLYLGGTTDRSVTSADLAQNIAAQGRQALYIPKREDCAAAILKEAQPGDKVIIMGARDDTLSLFAYDLLLRLKEKV